MPKLSGLTTEGEATVPLGDLSPYTEEQLLERVHRVHILFACMDCKKSWVELKEMLRHMVDGGCTGEKKEKGKGAEDKVSKEKPEDGGEKGNQTDEENEFPIPNASPPRTRSARTYDRTERKHQKKNETKQEEKAEIKVQVKPKAPKEPKEKTKVDITTPEPGMTRRSSRTIKRKSALELLGMKSADDTSEDIDEMTEETPKPEETKKRKLEEDDADTDENAATPKRGRGRPSKNPRPSMVTEIVLPEARTPRRLTRTSTESKQNVQPTDDSSNQEQAAAESQAETSEEITNNEKQIKNMTVGPSTEVTISIEVTNENKELVATETETEDLEEQQGEVENETPEQEDTSGNEPSTDSPAEKEMKPVPDECFEEEEDESDPRIQKLRHFGHLFTQRSGAPSVRRSEKAHRCNLCKARFFETEEELEIHQSCHIHNMDGFQCCVCGHKSKNWNSLLPHIVTHPEMKEQLKDADMVANIYGTFKCSLCKKVFDKLANLKLHISKVHYKQPSTCNVCGQTFVTDEKTFKRHVDKCTGITYQCEHCKYSTMVQDNMAKHMKVHLGKGHRCEICNKVFPTKQRRDIHAAKHDPNRVKHVCEICAHEFCTQDAVKKHVLRMHSGLEAKFKCDFPGCQFTCKLPLDLRKHNMYVHQKKFKCNYCDYQSNSKTAMDGHKAYHNPTRKFPCHHDQCFYRGISMKQLSNHISQVHRLGSKHQCPICQRWYKKKTHLARHLVSHTGEKPYSCLECGESYSTHSAYYRHRNLTGHDAKREGIVSVPQNITIKYITDDYGMEENNAETLYMSQEQQNAIESLITIPQQAIGTPQLIKQESNVQEEQVLTNEEVVEHIIEHIDQPTEEGGIQQEEQTIYLDADGRGTATAIVDGKEVTYVLHVDEDGQYHVETTDGGVDETTIIETIEAAEADGNIETQTIVMQEGENVAVESGAIQDEQALEQIQEVIYQTEEASEGQTVVQISPPGGAKGDQQYAILMIPPDGSNEPVSEAALSMLQLQSSGVQQ